MLKMLWFKKNGKNGEGENKSKEKKKTRLTTEYIAFITRSERRQRSSDATQA
jgi:hypothetical protein